ncbi:MAG: ATP synthase F0 subunit B [Myxococcota bacterium]
MLQILPDLTLLIQIALFLILIWAMNALLFRPALRVLEERDRQIAGGRAKAAALEAEVSSAMETYARGIREARAEGERVRARLVQEAASEEARIAEEGRAQTAESARSIRAEITRESAEARADLETRVREFAAMIAERALGRSVT